MGTDNDMNRIVKIDFHAHSKYSTRPSQWVLQKLGCAESYTEPRQLYDIALKKGMTHVTITDHNTLNGVLEIAHLPNVIIGEEITAYFPEDQCKAHILAYGLTERQHQDIQHIRANIIELAHYLRREGIFHAVAHPLYAVNERLGTDHFEKLLLLFNVFELNGSRNHQLNQCLSFILSQLRPEDMQLLAEKHQLTPLSDQSWRKKLIGGSDDHSGLNIARAYTEIQGAVELLGTDCNHSFKPCVTPATPHTMAHNLYAIAYQFYRHKFNLERYAGKDILMKFLDRILRPGEEAETGILAKLIFYWNSRKHQKSAIGMSDTLAMFLKSETRKLILTNPQFLDVAQHGNQDDDKPERQWFEFVNGISNKLMHGMADRFFERLSRADVFDIFHTIGSAGGLYALLAPFFLSYSHFRKDMEMTQQVMHRFSALGAFHPIDADGIRVAHFTDTFHEVNGVARSLQQNLEIAKKYGKRLTVITCDAEKRPAVEGAHSFLPVGVWELPEYPEIRLHYPPLLEMLDFCHREQFTHIHAATPGPIGLAGLAIAKILKLPISGTYHTAFPQYARYLTGDDAMMDLAWKYMLWYYNQLDCIYAPSDHFRQELVNNGIEADLIKTFPRGINIELFHPAKRNGLLKQRYGIQEPIKMLYVGRVSKEKSLDHLAAAFKTVVAALPYLHLVVVGDGPYLNEMKAALKGSPCTFAGYLQNEELATVYASSDIFIFPSATDTFGNVVLEAQASGIPVIVTDKGGPKENIIPNVTGLVVKAHDSGSLAEAMQYLAQSPEIAQFMGKSGRHYMEERSFESAFLETWNLWSQVSFRKMAKAV